MTDDYEATVTGVASANGMLGAVATPVSCSILLPIILA